MENLKPLQDLARDRDLVCYRAMGLLEAMVASGSIPECHAASGREILAEYREAHAAISAHILLGSAKA